MPACSTIPQSIDIEPGKLVYVVAGAQSSQTQAVVILDSEGRAVFEAEGSSHGGFEVIGSGTFHSGGSGEYTVELTQRSGVLPGESAIVFQGTPLLHTYSFITGDGGCNNPDEDFNDLYVSITIFQNEG